ncbi:MAG: hypothetical protein HF314_09525 [Ignavibacteria bacterium]|jgi:hypothetical protein|nr:hypothetical protein [Ignavibacteria bacterium]MCU7503303.1 hypothetical protein [Ignavibacteria bacterium]MCU7515751.1 hypothetical protein [Ignavibacteria bacterium]
MNSSAGFFRRHCKFILIFLLALAQGCSVNEPGNLKPYGSFSVSVEEVSSTEAWIRLRSEPVNPWQTITLQRDGSTILSFRLQGKDTLICEDSLSPGRQYTYRAIKGLFPSEEVRLTTMDTTSHDFHFRSFSVSNRTSGLWDVAIINDNDIWAVGDMYSNLPEGKDDYEPVGAVHWDGKEWKQVKLPAYVSHYTTFLTPMDVLAFSGNDIWFANGGVIHFDGKKVTKCYWIVDFSGNFDSTTIILEKDHEIRKLWGSSSENIYAVGRKGAIAHFDGKKWKKIESGTDLDIQDVWGSTDPITGEEVVICVAANLDMFATPRVLRIKNDRVTELPINGLRWNFESIWFLGVNKIFLGGDGIFTLNRGINPFSWDDKYDEVTRYYTHTISGNASNDFAIAGGFGEICHFNGKTWKNYMGSEVAMFYGNFYGMDMKGNTICAVGSTGSEAILYLGQRTIR